MRSEDQVAEPVQATTVAMTPTSAGAREAGIELPPPVVTSLPRPMALRVALLVSAVLILLVSTVAVANPYFGMASDLFALGCLVTAAILGRGWVWVRWLPHAVVAGFCLLVYAHLCATQCGTFAYYQQVAGVETPLLGLLTHTLLAVGIWHFDKKPAHMWVSDGLLGLGVGISAFFGILLAAHGSYCSGCVAAHTIMLAQLVAAVIALPKPRLFLATGFFLAGAGLTNAVYHHRAIPIQRNAPDELLAFLRSEWTGPRAGFVQGNVDKSGNSATSQSILQSLLHNDVQDMPIQGKSAQGKPSQSTTIQKSPRATSPASVEKPSNADRPVADANLIGRPEARITMSVHLDAACSKCAQQVQYLNELMDLVDRGQINMRLFISGDRPVSNAMATTMYAAGLTGEHAFRDTVTSVFAHNQEIEKAEDIFALLPLSFPPERAQNAIMGHQAEIERLLTDTMAIRSAVGISGTPTIILENHATGNKRVIPNQAMGELLRIAISSM